MRKWLRLCLVTGWCAAAGWAVDWKALRPQGHVSDFAGVVDPGSKSPLETYCGEVERAAGVDIVLVVLPSLENEPVEGVAKAVFEAWTGGPRDARVMLLLTVADRRSYVATGGDLPPAIARGLPRRVLREIGPALRRSDYNEALRAAAGTVGGAAAQASHIGLSSRLPRRLRWSLADAIPWTAIGGGFLALALLLWAGTPAGYTLRPRMGRSTWGSRGGGGFGGYDSGDTFGGFGGGSCSDW
jgi:uncharacterized protein